MLRKSIAALLICVTSLPVLAQNYWKDHGSQAKFSAKSSSLKETFSAFKKKQIDVDFTGISQALLNIDNEVGYLDLDLPLPDGTYTTYRFTESSIMQSGLAANYPHIKTFKGVDTSNANNKGRFDVNELGFHGMFRHNGELIYIDPEYIGETSSYASYYAKSAIPLSKSQTDIKLDINPRSSYRNYQDFSNKGNSSGDEITYRLLVSATGGYTEYFGSKSAALSAITTMVNRVNEVYQSDLGITLELVDETEDYIYTDPDTDPYADNGSTSDLYANANVTSGDSSKFDIGHLVMISNGGVATAGVCDSTYKAMGMTGSDTPTGDSFYIDYVAHEIGHQFDANHTFNGSSGSCSGNGNSSTANEPGSGSTIMAYAGICGNENLQTNSDAYFHAASINEISSYVNSGDGASCGTATISSNNPPVADAGDDFVIPARVPFIITGSATDEDGDTLTYTWEQMDLGDSSSSEATMEDDGARPIFRSWEGTTTASRYLPRLSDVIENTTVIGEAYPATDRDLNFRLTVRDQNNGTACDDMKVTVIATTNIFEFTSPADLSAWSAGDTQTVTWEVADTDTSPISCSSVDILLSPSNDGDFSETLASNTINDGSATVTVPNSFTSDSNLMLRCSDNRFYNVLNNNIAVTIDNTPATGSVASACGDYSNRSDSTTSSTSNGSGSFSWWMIFTFLSLCAFKLNSRYRIFYKK